MDTVLKPITIHKTVLRIAVGAMFFMAGLCFASWASRIGTVQHKLGLSYSTFGLVLFSLPVGLSLSLPFSGWIISKVGSKRVLLTAITGYGLVLIGLGLAQNTIQLVVCLALYGFAGNTVNISVNTQAVATEKLHDKPIMASFHGLWSGAGFMGGMIGAFMIGKRIDPFHHFIIILVIVLITIVIASKYLYDDHLEAKNAPVNTLSIREKLRLMIPLLPLGSIAFCSMICEGAMFDWSVIYFKNVLSAPSAIEGYGFAAFMFTMAGGRFIADYFSHRFGLRRTLQVSGSLTVTGLLIAVIFPHVYTAMAGFMLVGAGVSSVVPMVYSAAGKSKTMSPGVALAAVSTIGFVGFLVGPPVIGFIAGLATLRASFLFVGLMGALVVILSTRAKLDS
ncbi:MFS transporter [Mucilaginibacter gotjawali]|uniref:MFS family permease n=2 Tax=Mucilaginibacter gotjawali TaxID=1550579 RepID=A0A839SKC6_9SPHI|nr:MFS transporter [Mucilaginibacter gotjawali]MBB3057330.1 MFS family permease [Mucilaginibacter gotjawali]BAU52904.1 Inner membrane protein YbjJ [Mucilaginibacter gotjawali]